MTTETEANPVNSLGDVGAAWLPIESAPKDGTWFLAFEPSSECGAYYACSFHGEDEFMGTMWLSSCGQYVTSSPEPTHWLPLPPAPTPQEARHD